MPIAIHAEEKPLAKIFSNDFVFTIPRYQRPYAWTIEQAGELLSDVSSFVAGTNGPVAELNPYFLGSIVLIKGDLPDSDVVDGQQRLTTLTILLAALRKMVPREYAEQITKYLYEQGDLIIGTPNRYRLTLAERSRDFFREHIQAEGGLDRLLALNSGQLSDSHRNLQTNAGYFLQHENGLSSLSETERVRLLQYLMTRCYLVVVSTPDLDSAYRIFSVMNSRGLDLGLTDILKAEIIGAIDPARQEYYTRIWETEEEDLGRASFQELFTHIRMIFQKAKPRESVLAEFRRHVQPAQAPDRFIDTVLKPYSDAFELIRDEVYLSDRNADQVNDLFRWLNQIDNADWVPPAILYLASNIGRPDLLVPFFRDLERLAAGLMIRRADINERIERYGQLLSAIEQGADLYDAGSPLQLRPEECPQILAMLDGDLYQARRIRQYVLLRLDSALARGEATYDYPILSVEHVLPQHPPAGSEWTRWFLTPEDHQRYVHRLGNLVLLSRRKNAQAQNYDFDQKKSMYFVGSAGVSPFALTTQVLQQREWTPQVIEARQASLLGALSRLWRLDEEGTASAGVQEAAS